MKKPYPTPHIAAAPEDFAKTVLMPGDPLRSKFIAENFITDARLVNNVRGVQGYTGTYRGVPVSVMASGMGIPSMAIYSHELFNFFGVENIIRIGSAGAMLPDIELRDVILALGACTDSAFADKFGLPGTFAPTANYKLLRTASDAAEGAGLAVRVGNVLSSDVFYEDPEVSSEPSYKKWARMGVLAVEMESAALYMNAARAGKNALAILTVSDNLPNGSALDADSRERSFTDMVHLALETAFRLA